MSDLRLAARRAFVLLACAAPVAAADSRATFVVDRCVLSVELDGRVIYRGKPRCKNAPREIEIVVPRSRGVRLRTNVHAFYANGGIWAMHDDTFLIPLVAGTRYEIGEGYAAVAGETPPPNKHCIGVSADRRSKLDAWSVTHYGDREGPFDLFSTALVGGRHPRHELHVSSGAKPTEDKLVRYYRLHAGTYHFHVTRAGRISLSMSDADPCATR